MSSFRFRSNLSVKIGFTLASSILLSGTALAQTVSAVPQLPAASQGQSSMPMAAPSSLQRPSSPPVQAQRQPEQEDRKFALPVGASIGDASARVRNIAAEANKSLDELVGANMTPREQLDVDAIAERQRRLMLLKDQLEEAKLAKQIWQELHGKDTAEDSRTSEQIKKLEEEKSFLEKRLRDSEEKSSQRSSSFDGNDTPVVASITGAGGAASARLLIPFAGVVTATSGTILPNGMKIVSITTTGVTASKDGKTFTLPYGSSVPRYKNTQKIGQTVGMAH